MVITKEISLYELLFLTFSIVGGFFALFQWRQTYKLKRAEFLKEAQVKIRENKEFASVLYEIDYGVEWYTQDFIEDHSKEQMFDEVFAFFDYLCYLKNRNFLRDDEFRVFKYRIRRMACNQSFLDYFFNLYHFTKRNSTDFSFYNLLQYLKDNNLLDADFWDKNSKQYRKLLNF
ncbi:MAG: hypothetical protein IJT41_13205 [Clostridia bacterium]|nr:hypothetical protein [Clostridia bacterium]